ncbi:MAG: HD domain-containing protein [Desulfobacteraceae bacterium]|nr:MAG: HD domain-containing protein [Desulfobacteraceae bacterium]
MTQSYYKIFKLFSAMSKAIHSGKNPREIIQVIVAHAAEFTRAKGAIFWIVNTPEKKIQSFISHGFEYQSLAGVDYDTLIQIFKPDSEERVFIEDARYDERIPDLERLGKKRVGSVTGINLDITSQYSGILAIYFTGFKQLDGDELELVNALGEQGAIALHKALSYDGEMLKILRQIVEGFVLAIEARDETTHGHSMKVARLAKLVAEQMGLSPRETEIVFHAGLLHDIGKIGLEDYILEHLGTLSKKEMDTAKKHPLIGAGIVRPLTFLDGLEPIIKYHHERYNGSGYPDGLKGDAIPLGARIVGVCDVFETMISGRRHIRKMDLPEAVSSLKKGASRQFDPRVINALFEVIKQQPGSAGLNESVDECVALIGRNIDDMALEHLKNPGLDHPIGF